MRLTFALLLSLSSSTALAQTVGVYGPAGQDDLNMYAGFAGLDVTVISDAEWRAMTTDEFAAYDLLFVDEEYAAVHDALDDTADVWGDAVTGRIYLHGTDPAAHGGAGGEQILVDSAIDWLLDGGGTAFYGAMDAGWSSYDFTSFGVSGCTGGNCGSGDDCDVVDEAHPAVTGLTDANFSNWSYTTHNYFDVVPADFETLATVNRGDGVERAVIIVRDSGICGDGEVGPEEECDDGDVVDTNDCTAACLDAECGDRIVWDGVEECDDGNLVDEDSCTGCYSAVCGDGIIWSIGGTEECDDGNADAGDGCDDACVVEHGYTCDESGCYSTCGDGLVASDEECDDAGVAVGDGCSDTCEFEPGYSCEGEPSDCALSCGNGIIDGGEGCDDENYFPGDGCDGVCQPEEGFDCTGEPSDCVSTCGDGALASDETCDDGNTDDGDECPADCGPGGGDADTDVDTDADTDTDIDGGGGGGSGSGGCGCHAPGAAGLAMWTMLPLFWRRRRRA